MKAISRFNVWKIFDINTSANCSFDRQIKRNEGWAPASTNLHFNFELVRRRRSLEVQLSFQRLLKVQLFQQFGTRISSTHPQKWVHVCSTNVNFSNIKLSIKLLNLKRVPRLNKSHWKTTWQFDYTIDATLGKGEIRSEAFSFLKKQYTGLQRWTLLRKASRIVKSLLK